MQSNVTARVRALEERLGVELFERTNRGATLTAAGLRLQPYADRVAGCSRMPGAPSPTRHAGRRAHHWLAGDDGGTAAVVGLADFVAAWPAVDLSLRTGTTHELIEQTIERRLDGAFSADRSTMPT